MTDLVTLLPNAKKESKFDSKSELKYLNELCELTNCDHVLFFESRKHEDLYLWLAKAPEGPTFKFHVLNGMSENWKKLYLIFKGESMFKILLGVIANC